MPACLRACGTYRADLYTVFGRIRQTLWVRSSALYCVCVHACMHVVYRADLHTVFMPTADIVGQVLSPRLCMCVYACVCVYVCACMHVCDQLSAQVVFMKLSENLFFEVVLDFDLLPHP